MILPIQLLLYCCIFILKVPPPGIDFTLPSPPIGQSQCAVVDPPWMPHVKNKVEELSLKEEEQATVNCKFSILITNFLLVRE